MRRRLRTVTVVAVTVTTAGMLASSAMASDGVSRARAAGIHVSAAAAEMMAAAPAGTCMADPTARKCPKVQRIVARASAATGCDAVPGGPSKSTWTEVFAYAYSVNCGSNTVFNEISTTLQRYTEYSTWQQMDVAIKSRNGSGDVGATARWGPCTHRDARAYRTRAFSYSRNRAGTAYTQTRYGGSQLLSCRPPN
jgi:hypothetical protein